jgi:uncharacterized membrane protein YfcA
VTTIGLTNWKIIVALCLGGAIAAPLAAIVTRTVNPQRLMIFVGVLILVLSFRTLLSYW